jgi:hypothetical protein
MIPALLVVAACISGALQEPTKAVRGLAAAVDLEYAPKLRARADQSANSPILVRVSPGAAGRQHIEFIGAVAGDFDLRNYVERDDAQPLSDLGPIPVTVISNLPADAGVDLYGSDGSWLNWRVHYRELMWTAAGLWLAIPGAALAVRALRRPRAAAPSPPSPPPPTIADQLRAALELAAERPLTVEESGQLELLVLRFLGADRAEQGADLAAVLREVRADEATGPLVLAIERWLHAKCVGGDGDSARARAAEALEALRRTRLAAARPDVGMEAAV